MEINSVGKGFWDIHVNLETQVFLQFAVISHGLTMPVPNWFRKDFPYTRDIPIKRDGNEIFGKKHILKEILFSETRPFYGHFLKKLLLDKQIFPSQMPDLAETCTMMVTTGVILASTCAILTLTWFCHLSRCLWSLGGLEESQGGTPLYMKKNHFLKLIFRP